MMATTKTAMAAQAVVSENSAATAASMLVRLVTTATETLKMNARLVANWRAVAMASCTEGKRSAMMATSYKAMRVWMIVESPAAAMGTSGTGENVATMATT